MQVLLTQWMPAGDDGLQAGPATLATLSLRLPRNRAVGQGEGGTRGTGGLLRQADVGRMCRCEETIDDAPILDNVNIGPCVQLEICPDSATFETSKEE